MPTEGRAPLHAIASLKPQQAPGIVALLDGAELRLLGTDIIFELERHNELSFSGWRYPTRRDWYRYWLRQIKAVLTLGVCPPLPKPERRWFESPADRFQRYRPSTFRVDFALSAYPILQARMTNYTPFRLEFVMEDEFHIRHPLQSLPNLLVQGIDTEIPRNEEDGPGRCRATFVQVSLGGIGRGNKDR